LLPLHDNENYDASYIVEEDDNFPEYVKLSFAEEKNKCAYLNHCTRMNDGKLYLSNYMMIDSLYANIVKPMKDYIIPFELERSLNTCQHIYINGPAHTVHNKDHRGLTKQVDTVYCIHCDMWPNSTNSFITIRKPNNWPSNSMLANIQSQGCDVAPVGYHGGIDNDIQWCISFPGEHNLLLELNDVQILCYALIKIILKETLNTFQREVVSSFHIKHVMF
jgi:hypothetical protein